MNQPFDATREKEPSGISKNAVLELQNAEGSNLFK